MAGSTYKLTTLIGESPSGIEDAVTTALATSAGKVHGQSWIEVKDIRANVGDAGSIERWQVQIEVAFAVDEG
jgi:flavin-binding protein dodecin